MSPFGTRQSFVWIACVFFSTLWPAAAAPAHPSAQLSGSVLDATGLPLVGATITLRGAAERVTQSGSEGRFDFQGLSEGEYELNAALHGFAPARQTTRLAPGQQSTMSLTLMVSILERTVATASRVGEADVQNLPMAVSTLPGTHQGSVLPGPAPWAAERRACEGCPRRSVGHAFVDTTVINVFYELANLARGQATARITPKTWWANMEQGLVWDLDDFLVNQIGHPYQGNNYFNAGRANGLSFWESAGLTAFGSATWEYFGETNHASLNDLINTTLGGIALGEMFHRAAWLVRDTRATGRGRLMKEIAAMVIDPVTGAKRFLSGDASRVSEKPAAMVPSALDGLASAGVLWRGSNTRAFDSAGTPFLELDVLYGDPTTGRSRTAYDAFGVLLRFGGGSAFSEAKVRGRLLGQPFQHNRFQLNVLQAYDFSKNTAYQFGSQSFNVNAAYHSNLSSRLSLFVAGWGGLMALGAVDSIPLTGVVPEEEAPDGESPGQGVSEGPRYYDYGPGFDYGARSVLVLDGRPIVAFVYDTHHLRSLDGVRANHFLQQLRLDVMAPLRGRLGIGVSGEYFDRRTYFQDAASETAKFHFPQVRVFLTWRLS